VRVVDHLERIRKRCHPSSQGAVEHIDIGLPTVAAVSMSTVTIIAVSTKRLLLMSRSCFQNSLLSRL
jgi:hypothetical protein